MAEDNVSKAFDKWLRATFPDSAQSFLDEIARGVVVDPSTIRGWERLRFPEAPEEEEEAPVIPWAELSEKDRQEILTGPVSPATLGYTREGYEWVQQYDPILSPEGGGTTWWIQQIIAGPEDTSVADAARQAELWQQREYNRMALADNQAAFLARDQFQLAQDRFEWEKQQNQRQLATNYETYRLKMLSELTDPADWITRWKVSQTPAVLPEPTSNALPDFGPRIDQLKSRQDALNQMREEGFPGAAIRFADDRPVGAIMNELLSIGKELAAAKPAQEAFLAQQAAGGTATQQPNFASLLAEVGNPPAPKWLPQFVPSQVAGQAITPGGMITPSGQQWTSTPHSVREGLRGFAEFSGRRPLQDIMEQMQVSLPQNIRGQGQGRRTAAQQRT